MVQIFKQIKNTVIFKIISPVLLITLSAAAVLYYFNLKAISDFAQEHIEIDILGFSHEIYNICDRNLTDLLFEGRAEDETSVKIKKGLTIDSIENFARQKDIGIFIYSPEREIFSTGEVDKHLLDAAIKNDRRISTIEFNDNRYYAYSFNFEPWQWQIIILNNPDKYTHIWNKVQLANITFGITIFFITLFLIWSLNKSINVPVRKIIESVEKGSRPHYKGVKEFEFLSNSISNMMLSLENKVSNLEANEKELNKANEFKKSIINSINDALYIIEAGSFNIIEANQVFKDRINVPSEEIIGKTCYEVIYNAKSPCEQCRAKDVIEQGKSITYEEVFYRNDGTAKYLEISVSPVRDDAGKVIHLVYVARDITERRHLEEQFRQSQKLESIGILSGGIAHDFNNILTGIIGFGNLLQMKLDKDSPLNYYTEQILRSSERAAKLVSNLLAFSRKQIINPIPLNLNETIHKAAQFLKRLLEENIELKVNFNVDKLIVLADSIQIEQVLMNLATNARDAMPEGGTLTIQTDLFKMDKDFIKIYGYGKAGNYALITVTDNGTGIDSETIQKIFDPFFTTKEVGKGTGLGLSTAYGIIKQHNGFISVDSEKGKGTTFSIYLPLIEEKSEKTNYFDLTKKDIECLEGSETILIAEDEKFVRDAHSEFLTKHGYTVLEAADGQDALQIFLEQKDNIALVLTDVIMPRKNGWELSEEIKKIKPEVKVIFTSGYSNEIIDKKELLEKGMDFLIKPVSPENLLKMIRKILDERETISTE